MSRLREGDEDRVDARILQAAQRLLRSHGPSFTMAQLAEAAEVSRATLYRRVPSREALAQRLRAQGIEPGSELGDPSRERILDATAALMNELGLRFTLELVAERAGVGPATVYRSFGDRDGLLRAFLSERSPRERLAAQLEDLEVPLETTLRSFVGGLLRFAINHPGLARIGLLGEGSEAEELERLRKGGRSTMGRLVAYLEAQVERGALAPGDPWLLASSLLGAALGVSLLAPRMSSGAARRAAVRLTLQPGDDAAIEERARVLVSTWLRGAERGARR